MMKRASNDMPISKAGAIILVVAVVTSSAIVAVVVLDVPSPVNVFNAARTITLPSNTFAPLMLNQCISDHSDRIPLIFNLIFTSIITINTKYQMLQLLVFFGHIGTCYSIVLMMIIINSSLLELVKALALLKEILVKSIYPSVYKPLEGTSDVLGSNLFSKLVDIQNVQSKVSSGIVSCNQTIPRD